MIPAIQSELRKFLSTKMWWVLAIVTVGYVGLSALSTAWALGWLLTDGMASAGAGSEDVGMITAAMGDYHGMVYGMAASLGYFIAAMMGALAVTAEYRHNTIAVTFLAEPRRWIVVLAKVVAALPMGLILAVVAVVSALGLGALGFVVAGDATHLGDSSTWRLAGLQLVTLMLWTAIGTGLGLLVRSQVGVIIGVLVFTLLLEPILRMIFMIFESTRSISRFLPSAASEAAAGGESAYSLVSDTGTVDLLSVPQGILVLLAYGVVFGVAGYFLRVRRDVA
ncbi:MAG: ABC transporter permease [Propionibacteriaceae bacterium]|jgi:ABC-type transport system involved in multi-copper enzyme maturation permease subunit|nr:ABC transporter permease [Propionibacteriaceae bacterium]